MRYVIEFLIPAMVVIVAALVLFRNRPDRPAPASANRSNDGGALSTGTFIAILIIGAVLTVALVYALLGNGS